MGTMTTTTSAQLSPTVGYRVTVTPAAWNGSRGGWGAGTPVVTEYATVRELHAALSAHGVPERAYSGTSYRHVAWGLAVPEKLPQHVTRLAFKIYKDMTATYQQYLDSCEQERARGFRPSHCEHGTYMWTDYDNICGACEDGYSLRDKLVRWQLAKEEAVKRHQRAMDMIHWATRAAEHGMTGVVDMAAVSRRYDEIMGN